MTGKFWMVLGDKGHPPTYRHDNKKDAIAECERLSVLSPGEKFFLLEVIGWCRKNTVVWEFDDNMADDVPF